MCAIAKGNNSKQQRSPATKLSKTLVAETSVPLGPRGTVTVLRGTGKVFLSVGSTITRNEAGAETCGTSEPEVPGWRAEPQYVASNRNTK
jgi:hypothetical protein